MRELTVANLQSASSGLNLHREPIVFLVIVSLFAILPAFINGVPSNIDLSNHFRFALPFFESIQQGRIYPGWLAESNAGYGDPSFRFYPPGLYYLLAIARFLTGNWYVATLSVIALVSMTGALGAYFWARQFLSSQVAVWAGVFYTLAPYRLNQLYQAFMLAEFAGAAILAFVLGFTERVCRRRSFSDIAGLSISIAALVFTHLPLAVIALLALPIYAALRIEKTLLWSRVLRLSSGVTLGLAASACYWVTMVAELQWIRADRIKPDPSVEFRRNFIFSTLSPENLNVWWMNILVLATVALFWPCVVIFRRVLSRNSHRSAARAAALLAIVSLVMASPLSWPLWTILSPLQHVQFPWRWLTVATIGLSVAMAATVPFWFALRKDRRRPLALVAMGTVIVSVAFSGLHTVREANFLGASQFEATLRQISGSVGVSQWWPVWVNEPWKDMSQHVEAGNRAITITSWASEDRTFKVHGGDAVEARVKTFFYPHWVATANNNSLMTRPDKDGALLVSIPADETVVKLNFREPSRVFWTRLLTLLTWFVIAFVLVSQWRKTHSLKRLESENRTTC